MKQDCYQKLRSGAYYHIYNRGNNRENIFKEAANYYYFLELWWKYIEPVAKTFCYSLLPNHFHFFIRMEENIDSKVASKAFSNLFNAYSKTINKKYNRTGSLFQENFRRKEILNDGYFTKMICYILTNSVKHGYSKDSICYNFSAYQELVSDSPTKLLRGEVLDWFHNRDIFLKVVKDYESGLKITT